jgi:tetratricopeptide (TPR) repeat protein
MNAERLLSFIVFVLLLFSLSGCKVSNTKSAPMREPRDTSSQSTASSQLAVEKETIRFLEDRVKKDHEDFIACNKLAQQYLQRLRETGDLTYLNLAMKAARASLATLPPEQNVGGLTASAQVEYASHDFAAARDHALQLTQLEPKKGYTYQLLGDALLELGEYEKAAAAYRTMEDLSGIQGLTRSAIEQRLARVAALHGDVSGSRQHFKNALTLALDLPEPPAETVAWCRWQLGEAAFAVGDYSTAEQQYKESLEGYPEYFRALASLGKTRAAQGDIKGAIEQFEHAVRIIPDPTFVATLGDLYKLDGRETQAAAQYRLVEQIGKINELNGTLYNRQLALFYADHDIKSDQAYANASREYALRKDIYGADALAWAAFKNNKVAEAQSLIRSALRLGTQDARLFYHAGMIAKASGDLKQAREYLQRALSLNPQFDPMQAAIARKAFAE